MSADTGGGGGSIQVAPDTLTDASDRLFERTTEVTDLMIALSYSTEPANDSMSAVTASDGWSAFQSAWESALDRFSSSMNTFANNTEAAAVAYEDADRRAMPPVGPVIPSPEDLEEAWDEACEPNILGEVPEECVELA
jgi:uncharacterized protein YukE